MNKKICFVGLTNIMEMPYIKKYIELIDENYDLIYWDRKLIDEDLNASQKYVMRLKVNVDANPLVKLYGYIKFRTFASKILKRNDYYRVVLLTGNTAVLLNKILLRKYKSKYIIDIRDYFKEHIKWYYETQRKVINSSNKAVISSEAFKKFLPPHNYVVAHNSQNISENQVELYRSRKKDAKKPITVSCIGTMRYFDEHKKVLSKFKNDNRYMIKFIGSGSNLLKSYCVENNIQNVYIHDRFKPEETLSFYFDTDIILNIYGNENPLVDHLLSNKLYYAAQLGIPIIVSKNTYMEEVVRDYKFGFSFDYDNNYILDELYSYYNDINWQEFYLNCDKFMSKVSSEELKFSEAIKDFLRNDVK